jgi:hypothetical protein
MTDESIHISDFANSHPELLIIVGNPKSDKLFMSYGGRQVYNQIKSAEGKDLRVVQSILRRSTFGSTIDHFITALVDIFQVSLAKGNQFYQWIDAGVYALGPDSRKGRKHSQKNA